MIQAAQAAPFVASQRQRCSPVRTVLANHPQPTVAVAERDQVLAEQAHTHRVAVAFNHLLRKARGQPVAPYDLSHRRLALHATEQIVVFR